MSIELGSGTGPLRGVRVVELASLGPGPHACMLLADLGADVIRIDRPATSARTGSRLDLLTRGRPSVALDLKRPEAVATVLDLVEDADLFVEGMRPGVAERLGLGPADCRARNPRLVYGRMTGWGQDGPLATAAGHDLNYLALSGVLFGLGQDPTRPHFPSNLLGDFGGGSTYLVIGLLASLLAARADGQGQVVDAAILDGTAHLAAMTGSFRAASSSPERRGVGLLDGGAPFYDLYETADGEHMSVAALEPEFYDAFVGLLGIADRAPGQHEPERAEELRALVRERFGSRTRAEWTETFEGTDGCVAPVLRWAEAPRHGHVAARGVFAERDGVQEPAPAPRFSRTGATLGLPPTTRPGQHTREALAAWGVADVDALVACGAAVQAPAPVG